MKGEREPGRGRNDHGFKAIDGAYQWRGVMAALKFLYAGEERTSRCFGRLSVGCRGSASVLGAWCGARSVTAGVGIGRARSAGSEVRAGAARWAGLGVVGRLAHSTGHEVFGCALAHSSGAGSRRALGRGVGAGSVEVDAWVRGALLGATGWGSAAWARMAREGRAASFGCGRGWRLGVPGGARCREKRGKESRRRPAGSGWERRRLGHQGAAG